jgi:calcineurin-like phosphoesterase family protein
MKRKFVVADLHFGHKGVCKFTAPNGVDKLRPWDDTETMDDALVEAWNKTVNPEDEVYVLGDVTMNRSALPTVARCNGRKHLIKGNHDTAPISEYLEYFYEVSACRVLKDMILTHIPIHESGLGRFGVNVHGHLHAYNVQTLYEQVLSEDESEWHQINDPRYICVSIEQTNWKPVLLDHVRDEIRARKERWGDEFFSN